MLVKGCAVFHVQKAKRFYYFLGETQEVFWYRGGAGFVEEIWYVSMVDRECACWMFLQLDTSVFFPMLSTVK